MRLLSGACHPLRLHGRSRCAEMRVRAVRAIRCASIGLSSASMVIASVVMPPWCPHVGAVGRGLPARVCYVRVGVGSIVPPPTLRQRASADNELILMSAKLREQMLKACLVTFKERSDQSDT
jgi:hypothetical protein